jgi:2-polyprenyl-3-methyl-5-hydroxy-6-metoxy-1,4-benzoquinol methylase
MKSANLENTRKSWPTDGFEKVGNCPVCGGEQSRVLHEKLTDRVFGCAPGEWTLRSCEGCAAAFLDPRPTPQTIGLAYQRYFTHNMAPDYQSLGPVSRIRRRLANGYRNRKFDTQDYPASFFGVVALPMLPRMKAIVDAGMRHLPQRPDGGRLLDLGCGNGAFLLRARSAGWKTVGIDFDSKAVHAAQTLGLDVRLGGVESLDPAEERFNVITMSHVIEHVHDPVGVLRACANLLEPDGVLWVETPNICSLGHDRYGRHWRGLEPPRHLVLFSPAALKQALRAAGFSDIRVQPYRQLCRETFSASAAIAQGIDPYSSDRPAVPADVVTNAERLAREDPERREFITVQARK